MLNTTALSNEPYQQKFLTVFTIQIETRVSRENIIIIILYNLFHYILSRHVFVYIDDNLLMKQTLLHTISN